MAIFFQFISYNKMRSFLYRKIALFVIIYAGSLCDGGIRLSSSQNRNRDCR